MTSSDAGHAPASDCILITGATGFLGMQMAARMLQRSDRHIVALIRAADDAAAHERLLQSLRMMLPDPIPEHRLTAVAADLEADDLGLDDVVLDRLAEQTTTVLHCAASVSFVMNLEESREINTAGTRRMLEFARRCAGRGAGLERLAYVSTAYVAGRHRGRFGPEDLEAGQQFRNPYEQSKHEAEVLVRAAARDLPVQVFRPSIVVGERETGWTTSFNVLYHPYRSYAGGHYTVLPGRLDGIVDVVPVDFVADSVWALMQDPAPSGAAETHLLVAGEHAPTIREIRDIAIDYFSQGKPTIIHPTAFRVLAQPALRLLGGDKARTVLTRSKPFFPYFSVETVYDATITHAALRRHGIAPPDFSEYAHRMLDFAVAAKWGKAVPPRPRMVETAAGV